MRSLVARTRRWLTQHSNLTEEIDVCGSPLTGKVAW
jgi:hypothetical protein